jgi:predicted MFS family arabinose efflux permease
VAVIVASAVVSESVSQEERRLDLVGLLLGTSALFFLTYGLIEANQLGWTDPVILGSFGLFVILAPAFLAWEARNPHAMMPLRFFRIPAFSAGNIVAFSVSLAMFATFFFLTIYMQAIHGYTPFQAGLAFLPMTLAIVVTAPNAGRYASKHGSRAPMTYGLCLAGGGLLLLGLVLTTTTPYIVLFPVFVMIGHGMGSTMAPMTAAVMNAVGPQRAGLGSAVTNTSREVGGVLGIALLGAVLTTQLRNAFGPAIARLGLSAEQLQAIGEAARHGGLTTAGLAADQAAAVQAAFNDAFMQGFHPTLVLGGCILLAAALVANRFIPGRARIAEHHAAAEAVERGAVAYESVPAAE